MMENWRLSRIEEELDRLEIQPGSESDNDSLPPPPPEVLFNQVDEQQIYSKIVVLPAYKKFFGDESKEGVKKITEKYDSLGKVKPSLEWPPDPMSEKSSKGMALGVLPPGNSTLAFDQTPFSRENWASSERILSEVDVVQVEMFYRSHKTDVSVCQCMVHMYFGSLNSSVANSSLPNPTPEQWVYVKSGVAVWLLDSGESRRHRKLKIVLAEKGTGFQLWRDSMSHLTNYKAQQPSFHTMHLSNDHTKMAGFSFEDAGAAADFVTKLNILTSDPRDDILNLSASKKKKREDKKRRQKYKAPNKSAISSPCCFTHITKLDRSDGMTLLTANVPTSPSPNELRMRQLSPTTRRVSSLLPGDV